MRVECTGSPVHRCIGVSKKSDRFIYVSLLSRTFIIGTREQAFVYAMSAAAAVWRLARGCALGSLAACSCATPPRREPPSPSALMSPSSFTTMSVSFDTLSVRNSFKWGGCGDDVRSASRMAKRFLQGATPLGTGATAKFMHAVNMHNNRAGRRVSIRDKRIKVLKQMYRKASSPSEFSKFHHLNILRRIHLKSR